MKRAISILVPVIVLAGLIIWRIAVKQHDKITQIAAVHDRKNAIPNVTAVPAMVRDIVKTYEGIGSVEAPFNVKIAPAVTGRIIWLELREGDSVTAGQIVARLDSDAMEAQVHQQQANVAAAQARLAQAEFTANPTNVSVTSQIKQQRATVESATANLRQSEQTFAAQVASAQSSVVDAQSKVNASTSAINNAQATLKSAKATLANVQIKYDRTFDLYKQSFTSAQDVDDARTLLDVQKSAVEVATGQVESAMSAKKSAQAQLKSAELQAQIVATKGQADIDAAKAAVKQASAGLELADSNKSLRAAYSANLNALRAAVDVAKAQLKDAQAALSETVLTSSVSGLVTARYMDAGTIAPAGQPILAIQTIKQIFVTTAVPDDISRNIHLGTPAKVNFDAIPGKEFTGVISQVNPAADVQNRQFTARITLENPLGVIKPGMFAHVKLEAQLFRKLVVVPREAIRKSQGKLTVTVIDSDNKAHVRPVKIGPEDTVSTSVSEGLKAGELVVTLSQTSIKDGQVVKVTGAK